MTLTDTSPEARRAYFRRLSEMTPAERLRIGIALYEMGNRLQRAGLQRQYPDADESEIAFRMAELRFGSALARAAWKKS